MKKYILFIILLLFPFLVSAKTCDTSSIVIESVDVISTIGNASEKTSPSINNKNIGLDLSMNHKDDSITYKIVIKNNSKDDYELNSDININSDYIDYSYVDLNSNVVEANSTKEIYLKALYKNEVPASLLNNGSFKESKNMVLSLSTLSNPKTGFIIPTILVIIGIVGFMCYMIIKKEFNIQSLSSFIIVLLMVPIITNAACSIDINIKSDVEIRKMAIFDTGSNLNVKMNMLSGGIKSFKRSNTLPDNIKALVDSQLSQTQNISVSNDEIEEMLNFIKSQSTKISNLTIEDINGKKEYTYDDQGFTSSFFVKVSFLGHEQYFDRYYYVDNSKFLVFNDNTLEYDLMSEDELKNHIREQILFENKAFSQKNIFSSDSSDYIIYGWNEDNIIYYYCESDNVYLNKDSSYMFYELDYLEDVVGIEQVNSSMLENASFMFAKSSVYAPSFNFNISSWDTSNVTTMKGMFAGTSLGEMISGNDNYHISGLSNLDTSKVKDMSYMFSLSGYGDETYNIDLSRWNTSNVENMKYMFYGIASNASNWSVGDLSSWNTSKVKNMSFMFDFSGYNSRTWNVGLLANWDTSNVEDMNNMFAYNNQYATSMVLDLSRWNTSKVKDMSHMFCGMGNNVNSLQIGDLSNWNTSNVENMKGMFSFFGRKNSTVNIGNIKAWDVSKVKNMREMFSYFANKAENVNLDLSNWNTSSLEDMSDMFSYIEGKDNNSIIKINLSNMDVSKVKYLSDTFEYVGSNANSVEINISGWNTSRVEDMSGMFHFAASNAGSVNIIGLSDLNTSNVTDMSQMFYNAGSSATTWNDIGVLKIYNSKIDSIFQKCASVRVTLNFYNNPTSYSSAFSNASTTSNSKIDVYYKDTVTNITNIINTKSSNSNVFDKGLIE